MVILCTFLFFYHQACEFMSWLMEVWMHFTRVDVRLMRFSIKMVLFIILMHVRIRSILCVMVLGNWFMMSQWKRSL